MTPVSLRVQKRRKALRLAGLRPVQIWVPDTRLEGFSEACKRQSRLVAEAERHAEDNEVLESLFEHSLKDMSDWRVYRRGQLVTIAINGDFGKPRPALVIQANLFADLESVTLLPLTSMLIDAPLLRINIEPDKDNGLRKSSQIMVDKIVTVKRDKVSSPFGTLNPNAMIEVERCLAIFLGIAK